jgi:hypothetical protein
MNDEKGTNQIAPELFTDPGERGADLLVEPITELRRTQEDLKAAAR